MPACPARIRFGQMLPLLGLVLALTACREEPAPPWFGYAVGDYVYVASPLAGRLESVAVRAGGQVLQGAALFALEAESELAARDEAAARLANARALTENLDKGRRDEEVAVIQAQLAQAQANAVLAAHEMERQQKLFDRGVASASKLDDALTTLRQAQARVAELRAALQVSRLPARSDERQAARATAGAAAEALRQAEWRLGQKRQAAPVDARVEDVFYRPGEYIPAGQPVVSLLPPGNIKARFYVREGDLGGLRMDQPVLVSCDGCGAPIPARISRIAGQAEYTPPVIYSNAQRAKLMFMVEAHPEPAAAERLRPGQPLDVRAAP